MVRCILSLRALQNLVLIQSVQNPLLQLREMTVNLSSQSCGFLSSTVLVRFLNQLIIDLLEEYNYLNYHSTLHSQIDHCTFLLVH